MFKSSNPLKQCDSSDAAVAPTNSSESDSYWDKLDLDIVPPYLIVGAFVSLCGLFTLICAKKNLTERLMAWLRLKNL